MKNNVMKEVGTMNDRLMYCDHRSDGTWARKKKVDANYGINWEIKG